MICLLLGGCNGGLSTLEPAGPAAARVALLWWIMLAGATLLFLASSAVLAGAFLPSVRAALTPGRLILWGGLVVPAVVLTLLVVAAFLLGERLLAGPRADAPLRIEAIARQWVWEFRHPDGRTTFDRLHMPAGQDVDFVVTSTDVIHSFWIPRLGGKIDAIPGHETIVRLRADRPGVYGGVCAEFCGDGHTVMRFVVEAHAGEDYAQAVGAAAAGTQP